MNSSEGFICQVQWSELSCAQDAAQTLEAELGGGDGQEGGCGGCGGGPGGQRQRLQVARPDPGGGDSEEQQ